MKQLVILNTNKIDKLNLEGLLFDNKNGKKNRMFYSYVEFSNEIIALVPLKNNVHITVVVPLEQKRVENRIQYRGFDCSRCIFFLKDQIKPYIESEAWVSANDVLLITKNDDKLKPKISHLMNRYKRIAFILENNPNAPLSKNDERFLCMTSLINYHALLGLSPIATERIKDRMSKVIETPGNEFLKV